MRTRAPITLAMTGAILLIGAMTAFACTNLATLNLSTAQGEAGSTVDVTGSAFRTEARGGLDVEIRWDGVDGPVLATAQPDATGNIATSVRIPADAQPGYHVLVGTQMTESEDGELSPAYGTPARSSFLIGTSSPPEAVAPATGPASGIAADAPGTGLIALAALLALLGIGLFGSGLGLFVRETRKRAVTAPAGKE